MPRARARQPPPNPVVRELGAWIEECLGSDNARGLRFVLGVYSPDSRGQEAPLLETSLLGPLSEIVTRRIETAIETAAVCLGNVTFVARCHDGSDLLGTKHFRVRNENDSAGEPLARALANTSMLLGHYERLVAAQTEHIDALSRQRSERPMSRQDAGAATTPGLPPQVADKLALLLPVVANAIARKLGVADEGPAPSSEWALLQALFESFDEAQVTSLTQMLRPEQLMAFAALRDNLATRRVHDAGEPRGPVSTPEREVDTDAEPGRRQRKGPSAPV